MEDQQAILASNTSSIPIVELAAVAGSRGGRVLGMHFFNPVPWMGLVEVIPSPLTSPETTERARSFSEDLGKEAIIAPDRAGFTVNALLVPYLLSAIRMFEQGLASAEDIDAGMVMGCAHYGSAGPLRPDRLGHRTQRFRDPLRGTPRAAVCAATAAAASAAAGLLGRKTGRGLYSYGWSPGAGHRCSSV